MPHSHLRAGLAAAFLSLGAAFGPLLAQDAEVKTSRVTLVTVNDLDRMGDNKGRGGFAKLAAIVKAERMRGDVLFLHAGDAYSPSILSGFDKGSHIVDLLNQLKPDAFVPGNHEFDFGPQNFRERVKQSRFPVIASNIAEPGNAPVAGTISSRIVEIGGSKIGIYGLTTEDTATISSPGEITIAPALEAARSAGQKLRDEGAEIVIALVHTPLDVDLAMMQARVADVIVSGHDHFLTNLYDGKVLLTESESQADTVTVIDLLIEKTTRDGKTTLSWRPTVKPIDTAGTTPDPEMAAAVKVFEDTLDKDLSIEIGKTETPLDTRRGAVRGAENAFGNLICDAMRNAVKADLCITNGGGIRADREYAAGTVLTRKMILEELPFGNRTVLLELKGETIRAAIEHGLLGGGRFPQVSGMAIEADLTKPEGQRITAITVAGQPLEMGKTYTLATNDFMAGGGDGYAMFKSAKTLVDAYAGQYMAGQVMDYVRQKGSVAPKIEGRLTLKR
jgi:5'-nucleotidase / UDP-sugar diphosphatase